MDKRKVIYVVLGVILVIGIGLGYYLTGKSSNSMSGQSVMISPSPIINAGSTNTKQATQQVSSLSPEDMTKTFYDWYMNYPKDVVATGAYKTSPYLTDTFKQTIDGFAQNYNPKFDPIFCTPNKTKSYVIEKATSNDEQTKITVQITDKNVDAPKPLYNVTFMKVNGVWKINDIICD